MKLKITLGLAVLFAALQSMAATLTGTITDQADGSPLAGVSIILEGTTTGVITDVDGKFSLEVKPKSGNLSAGMTGYQTVSLPFDGSKDFSVALTPDTQELDEVVVVGYGVQKKSHLTGAISKYSGDNLADVPVTNLDQALQGRIAGVNIQTVDQEAGAAAQIRIRGMGSMTASSDPLVVVDGFPIADGLQFVNMNDVESVEVLKDAASAAIYGSRGANGVIMITTKSGNIAKPKYTVGAYAGVKLPIKKYDMMTATEYGNLMYQEAGLRGTDSTWRASGNATENLISSGERAGYLLEQSLGSTEWQDEGLRDYANISSYQFGVSGGKKEVKYYISGNYSTEEGIMEHSTYDKLNFKAKVDANLSKTVKFGVNLSPTYTKRETPANNFTDFWRWYTWNPAHHTQASADYINEKDPSRKIQPDDWAQPLDFASLPYSGIMPDGTFWNSVTDETTDANRYPSPSTSANNNPKSVMEQQSRYQTGYRLQGSTYLQWEPIKNLILRSTVNAYVNYTENENYKNKNATASGSVNSGTYTNKLGVNLLSENTVNYMFSLGKHDFTALGGYTFETNNTSWAGITGSNFPTDLIHTLNAATEISLNSTYTTKEKAVLISYFGRLNWSYNDKYLASASIRADGSSKFGYQKFGWFPSISAGWAVSEEEFMQPTRDWLKQLKLRGSFGVTGNNNIDNYAYVDKLRSANYVLGNGTGVVIPGLAATDDAFANYHITWEQTNEYDFGLDASFLNGRFTASLDYYYSITRQMLFKQAAMGFTGHNQLWNNIGKVRNKGFELEFASNNISTKTFLWKTSINMSHNNNRLLELGGEALQYNYGERNEVYAALVGDPAIQFFGYKTDGVWKNQEQIDESGLTGTSVVLGGLKIVDVNGDKVINAYDRTVIGNPFPTFSWGMNNSFTYKDWDFSFMFQGVHGCDVINGDAFYNEAKKYNKAFNSNRWVSQQHPGDGKTPYLTSGVDMMLTDYVVEKGGYVALRDVTLGYRLPKSLMQKIKLTSLRAYVSAANLLYFMNGGYRGLNPEARVTSGDYSSPLVSGYQRGAFPLSRTITLGLDLTF